MDKFWLLLLGLSALLSPLRAQELNCQVVVNAENIQTQDKRIFQDMERAFTQFMNDTRWTEERFQTEEKIKCRILINMQQMPSIGTYKATASIQSARPVYGTSYETVPFLFYADQNWSFEYTESQPLDYSPTNFTSNIVALLSFYANIIIGTDFDTFAEMGGQTYFDVANQIVSNAQSNNSPGWNQFDGNINRYVLIDDYLNGQMRDLRAGNYTYHRLALDDFESDPDEARKKILGVIENLEKIQSLKPNALGLRTWLDTKYQEIINIFSEGDMNVRKQVHDILVKIDPTRTDDYKKILSN
ncbi:MULTISPECIES: DUF4835 family protein [Persicobacter]|uniref:DUF4835 domain-containing protein n=1 Tax=Persicobacter diffluens TaxID=981 RepID=A0AAN4W0U3_9BACT|nr:DUF4835 family protein [Persicobacter sp. CCB-QB2]GJM62415.1 DUF4835 domain-containing protein [Persicobacter diffluens]